jgi:hypothetical protein
MVTKGREPLALQRGHRVREALMREIIHQWVSLLQREEDLNLI